tara:strand:+ start:193 stop:321 length:129 start_codon:yes stop_codon:yes gene_type:complete
MKKLNKKRSAYTVEIEKHIYFRNMRRKRIKDSRRKAFKFSKA